MTDQQLRGVVLKHLYDRRDEGPHLKVEVSNIGGQFDYSKLQRICKQLEEKGLLRWNPMSVGSGDLAGLGALTAAGVEVQEGTQESPLAITLDHSINVHNSHNVAFGNNNSQHWQVQFESLVKQIDASNVSGADKEEAKSLLKAFLAHPLIVSILGGVAGGLLA